MIYCPGLQFNTNNCRPNGLFSWQVIENGQKNRPAVVRLCALEIRALFGVVMHEFMNETDRFMNESDIVM